MAGGMVHHWKHGWIPLDRAAALSKAHGSHAGADKIMQQLRGEHYSASARSAAGSHPHTHIAANGRVTHNGQHVGSVHHNVVDGHHAGFVAVAPSGATHPQRHATRHLAAGALVLWHRARQKIASLVQHLPHPQHRTPAQRGTAAGNAAQSNALHMLNSAGAQMSSTR